MSLVATALAKSVGATVHLAEVSLDLRPGRIHTILGRTGAGKTSLLRVLAGLDGIDAGALALDGRDLLAVPPWERDTAMVYQQFINYPHLSVRDNVLFPLRRAKVPAAQAQERVTAALAQVGLTDFASRRPGQLSGGQQQRVAIARSLARRTRILLLDEPLVNLDFKLREQLREELRSLFSGVGDTIVVYTTTEPAEALMLGDQVIVMHEGRVAQIGSPAEVFERPASIDVARVVNDPPMTIIEAQLTQDEVRLPELDPIRRPSHLAGVAPGTYRCGVAAGDLRQADGTGLVAQVSFVEISGSETFVHLHAGQTELVMRADGIHDVAIGDQMSLAIDSTRLFVFDGAGRLVVAPTNRT